MSANIVVVCSTSIDMFRSKIQPCDFVASSKKNWGISAFPFDMYPLLEN